MVQHMGDSLIDATGNGNNGTATGTSVVNTYYGRSRNFDVTDDYIQTNYYPVFDADFTISFFVLFTTYGSYQNILSSMNSGSANQGFWLEFGTSRGFTLATSGAIFVLEDNINTLTSLQTGVWKYIVVTRNGTETNNCKLYIDNILYGQNTNIM